MVLCKGTLPGFYYVAVYEEKGVKRAGNNPIKEHGAASSSVLTARRPSLGSGPLVLPRLVLVLPRLMLVLSSAGAATSSAGAATSSAGVATSSAGAV